jgi:hypothetical protein
MIIITYLMMIILLRRNLNEEILKSVLNQKELLSQFIDKDM